MKASITLAITTLITLAGSVAAQSDRDLGKVSRGKHWENLDKQQLRFEERNFDTWRKVLATDLRPATRAKALEALGAFGSNGYEQEMVTAVIQFVRDDDPPVVMNAAATAIGRIGSLGMGAMIDLLKDENPKSRIFAARIFGRLSDRAKPATASLLRAMEDEDPNVRYYAIIAMRRMLQYDEMGALAESLVPILVERLGDEDENTFGAALSTLRYCGTKSVAAVPVLIKLLDSKSGESAIAVLKTIGPGAIDAVPALTELSKSANFTLSHEAARAIQAIKPEQ